MALLTLGRFEELITWADELLEFNPQCEEALLIKANAYKGLQDHNEHLKYCTKLLEIHPDLSELWQNKSNSLVYLNRFDEALFCLDKAIHYEIKLRKKLHLKLLKWNLRFLKKLSENHDIKSNIDNFASVKENAQKERDEFVKKFPLESLKNLTVEQYNT